MDTSPRWIPARDGYQPAMDTSPQRKQGMGWCGEIMRNAG
jgi:hypothetical protein